MKKKQNKNVVVEVPLPDGWVSMHTGRVVRRGGGVIVLVDAAWISDTGRRSEFFAGRFDTNCEIEPLPDGVEIELPLGGASVTAWPHPLPRAVR